MPQFETFKKSSIPLSKQPRVTIQKRGTITINAAAHAALGEPDAVELLYDRDAQILGLRAVSTDEDHAAFVRPTSRKKQGPWVISAMAFINFYEIDTTVARRWSAELEGGALCIRMEKPGAVVSKRVAEPDPEADVPATRPRPRPRPHSHRAADGRAAG